MPLYEFVCQDCQREQELLVRGEESPKCEHCGSPSLQKLLSVPAGHSAKGSPDALPPGPCGGSCSCFPGG